MTYKQPFFYWRRDLDIAEPTPLSDAALTRLPEFYEALEGRLRTGKAVYGDSSFEKSAVQLLEELRQEAADIAGWGAILYLKLTMLIEAQGRMLGRDQ